MRQVGQLLRFFKHLTFVCLVELGLEKPSHVLVDSSDDGGRKCHLGWKIYSAKV